MKELACKAYRDVDDTLLSLWEYGFDQIVDPSDIITGSDVKIAYRALGIPTRREIKSIKFWQSLFKCSEDEFQELLSKLDISANNRSKTIPKNSVKRLKAEAKRKNIQEIKILSPPPSPVFSKKMFT